MNIEWFVRGHSFGCFFYSFGQVWILLVLLKADPETKIWMQVFYLGIGEVMKGKEKIQ